MYPTIVPPGGAHLFTLRSVIPPSGGNFDLAVLGAVFSSIPFDFLVKTSGVADLTESFIDSLPAVVHSSVRLPLAQRFGRLVSLTKAYSDFRISIGLPEWQERRTVRKAEERRRILIDIDALCAIGFGIGVDALCTIYRTQFAVLIGYERMDLYDAHGRKVPTDIARAQRKAGENELPSSERRRIHPQSGVEYTFELPFRSFDREEDMRAAYAKFSKMLEEHGEIIEDGE